MDPSEQRCLFDDATPEPMDLEETRVIWNTHTERPMHALGLELETLRAKLTNEA